MESILLGEPEVLTVRSDWAKLSDEFSAEYRLELRAAVDANLFFTQLCNLKLGKKPIAQYTTEAEGLYRKCPEALKIYMGSQFKYWLVRRHEIGDGTDLQFPGAEGNYLPCC